MRTVESFQEAAKASGCRLVLTEDVTFAGEGTLAARYQCPDVLEGDPWAGPRLLEALAADDRTDLKLSLLAYNIVTGAENKARILHTYVKKRVRFRPEKTEFFASPWFTNKTGAGDCDDSERLLKALAEAAGIPARFVYFVDGRGSPAHVTVQLQDDGVWTWAEVTIDARYGEHPLAALKRLGLKRADIVGKAVLLPPIGSRPTGVLGDLGAALMNNGEPLPAYIDGGDGTRFASTFRGLMTGLVTDIDGALRLLLHESGLNPAADNGRFAGIFQVNHDYIPALTGTDVETFKTWTAEQQLPYAAKFWRSVAKKIPLDPRDLYWTNFLPATVMPGIQDSYVFVYSDDTYVLPDGRVAFLKGVYTDNVVLDHGRKGFITAGDMRMALEDGANEHPHLYPYLSALIGSSSGSGIGTALVALGIGLAAAGAAWVALT